MEKTTQGWGHGFIGMLIFSGSMPATRIAVADFDPLFLTFTRAAIAGILAILLLTLSRQKWPSREDIPSLLAVAMGVVVGFPLLTAFALTTITSAQSLIFIGLLPIFTAIFGFLRGKERPAAAFWLFALTGSALVAAYASHDSGGSMTGNFLMLLAIVICGFGYAEGALLSRRLGGWQVISWALVFSLPLMLLLAVWQHPATITAIRAPAWFGLGYVSLFSMLIGFIYWYKGLALGGISSVGQLQLLQPFFGLLISAIWLGESVTLPMLLVTTGAVLCVAGVRRFGYSR